MKVWRLQSGQELEEKPDALPEIDAAIKIDAANVEFETILNLNNMRPRFLDFLKVKAFGSEGPYPVNQLPRTKGGSHVTPRLYWEEYQE